MFHGDLRIMISMLVILTFTFSTWLLDETLIIWNLPHAEGVNAYGSYVSCGCMEAALGVKVPARMSWSKDRFHHPACHGPESDGLHPTI